MSHFSSVDTSPDPAALVGSLDRSAAGLATMKSYIAAAAARAVPHGLVLDLGCGAGHDLVMLDDLGLRPIGLDPSWVMVDESRRRLEVREIPVTQGYGDVLPFRDGSLDGCRIERVLQHVDDPAAVLAEVARVVRSGGFLAVFEPDWRSWQFASDLVGAEVIGPMIQEPRQPDIGHRLAALVDEAGFELVEQVTEASVVHRLGDSPVNVEASVERLAAAGRIDRALAERWLAEQRARDAAGTFRLHQSKVLVVAERRSSA